MDLTKLDRYELGEVARQRELAFQEALAEIAKREPAGASWSEESAATQLAIYRDGGYGHGQVFSVGESEETKLRRERDRLAQRVAEWQDEARQQREKREGVERQLSATRGVVTRIKNRIGHGVCPCCNRSFGNLAKHMAHQHPTWSAEAAE